MKVFSVAFSSSEQAYNCSLTMWTYDTRAYEISVRSILVLLSSVCPIPLNASLSDVSSSFVKSSPKPCGPTRLSSGWTALSKSACAFNCRTRYGTDCRGFMYNKVTRLCTPSSGLSGRYPVPNVTEGDLYLMRSSDIYPDFWVRTNSNNVSVNVAYFTNPLNYTDAAAVCACLDSHLYMADSVDKYDLVSDIVDFSDNVWIGLDDMVTEGTFVWSGSGQQLDMGGTLRNHIFDLFQPDNNQNNEDCVYEREFLGRLNDASCSLTMSYLCEKT